MVPFESSFESSAAVAGSIRLPHPIFQRCSEISSDSKTQDTGRGLYILYIRIYRTYVFLKSPFGYRVSRQVIFTFTTEIEGALQDLANVLWAVSRVACPVPKHLLEELEKRRGQGLPVVELVACISALAELRNVTSSLWKSVETLDSSVGTRALGTLLWAHGTAQVLPPASLVKMLNVSQMSPQSLANSLWAFAKLQLPISSTNIAAAQRILTRELGKFKAQEFASCVWAVGSMEKPAVKFFEDLQLPKLAELEDHHLSQAGLGGFRLHFGQGLLSFVLPVLRRKFMVVWVEHSTRTVLTAIEVSVVCGRVAVHL